MNILHATTDPDLLTRLREMLGSSARADIAVGYFFMSGFDAVADELLRLGKVCLGYTRAWYSWWRIAEDGRGACEVVVSNYNGLN